MHRSIFITAFLAPLALTCALESSCHGQVANAAVQVQAIAPAEPDPFTLDAPAAPSVAAPASSAADSSAAQGEAPVDDAQAGSGIVPTNAVAPVAAPALPRLAPRGETESPAALGKSADASTLVTVGGSLTLVVGLFLLVTWVLRRGTPQGSGQLPRDVVEMLGRAPLPGRQQMHLIRIGSKLLLVNVTPNGAETLTEITDPLEVDRLVGLCQQRKPNSSTAAFQSVLEDLSRYGDRDELAFEEANLPHGRRSGRAARGSGGARD